MLAEAPAVAQDEAVVNVVASVLAVEDARRFDEPLLSHAATHARPLVRRYAARAMGRIGNPAATPMLLTLLNDPDSLVRPEAIFALGQIGDRTAIPPLRELVLSPPSGDSRESPAEAITAIAKIGGAEAGTFFADFLVRWIGRNGADTPPPVARALWEAWRLGISGAPLEALETFAQSSTLELRTAALYSLMRLRTPRAMSIFLSASADADPYVRSLASRGLTRDLVAEAGLEPTGVATRLQRLVDDPDPRVRINALRSLASFADPSLAAAAAARITDSEPNVRVQALETLGDLGGADAARTLKDHLDGGSLATRRQALLSLARVHRRDGLVAGARWITADDWYRRFVGAHALGRIGGDTAEAWLEEMLEDTDGRVAGAAYEALIEADSARAVGHARRLLRHPDVVVRTLAARHLAVAPTRQDVAVLTEAYAIAQRDSIPDARIAVVRALAALAEQGYSERIAVEDAFLDQFPESDDYLVRRVAEEAFPTAAQRWGPATPIETGKRVGDYRDIARRLIVPDGARTPPPGLVIETERGRLEIELYGADAPLTVNAVLQLTDARYFDNGVWHRVVPGFVIQDGDPRSDGWGGPGVRVRDEVNRHRYDRGTVGMALSGPDTGSSQFFITLDRQPHLDGAYTVFGRVVAGVEILASITQGERIRTVRRR